MIAVVLAAVVLSASTLPARGGILFREDFERDTLGPSWLPPSSSCYIASVPSQDGLGNGTRALSFSRPTHGGDCQTQLQISSPDQRFRLRYRYRGTCDAAASGCGGFVGFGSIGPPERILWVTSSYNYHSVSARNIPDGTRWVDVDMVFHVNTPQHPGHLVLQDFSLTPTPARANDAFFDDIVLCTADTPSEACVIDDSAAPQSFPSPPMQSPAPVGVPSGSQSPVPVALSISIALNVVLVLALIFLCCFFAWHLHRTRRRIAVDNITSGGGDDMVIICQYDDVPSGTLHTGLRRSARPAARRSGVLSSSNENHGATVRGAGVSTTRSGRSRGVSRRASRHAVRGGGGSNNSSNAATFGAVASGAIGIQTPQQHSQYDELVLARASAVPAAQPPRSTGQYHLPPVRGGGVASTTTVELPVCGGDEARYAEGNRVLEAVERAAAAGRR